MESILQQYLASVPVRKFQWKDLTVFSEDVQHSILQKVMHYPLSLSHPPSLSYQKAFLKFIMARAEADECLVEGEVYELYANLVAKPNSETLDLCWKSYHLSNGKYVTLAESTNLVSKGTTGLTTWQAAFRFVEWLSVPEVTQLFQSKGVLELGSGVGFTGISLCLRCKPRSFCFTDYHCEVLERLRENVDLNINKPDCSAATAVSQLDWTSDTDIDSVLEAHAADIDCVVATDVVYEVKTIDSFVRCLERILRNNPQAMAFVASTIRNDETYQHFLTVCGSAGLKYRVVDHSSPQLFYYDFSQNIQILELKV